jgi:hypothetical protein
VVGLSMGQWKAVTKAIGTRSQGASKVDKGELLDELCATTGWARNHARKALGREIAGEIGEDRGQTAGVQVIR